MKKLLSVLTLVALLSGCAVYPAPLIIKPGHGGHCPPGQAKKGNC